jgi:nicotinamidase-related amidase
MIRTLWAERGLAQVIAERKRSSVILAGRWLETDITILALSALADGFDAYILLDVSPSQDPDVRQFAIDRMLQAGAVPISTVQLLHEWAERSRDDTPRRALLYLLGPCPDAPTEGNP